MINQIAGKVLKKCFFLFSFFRDVYTTWSRNYMEYASASALVGTLHLYLLAGIFFETYFSIESTGLTSISEDKIS